MDSQDTNENGKCDLVSSLEFALTVILTAIKERTCENMQTASVVIHAGFVFQVSRIEWLFLLMSIFSVVALKLLTLLSKT